jgi:hypothetical protein
MTVFRRNEWSGSSKSAQIGREWGESAKSKQVPRSQKTKGMENTVPLVWLRYV